MLMKRSDILEEAGKCVNVDRMKTYGPVENSFGTIANLWSAYLDVDLTAEDAAAMMGLLKIARIKTAPTHADNWVDLAGYAACGGEIATDRADPLAGKTCHEIEAFLKAQEIS
jgi:hypothetical protein